MLSDRVPPFGKLLKTPVSHRTVANVESAPSSFIPVRRRNMILSVSISDLCSDNELFTGVHGRLKNLPGQPTDRHMAFIGFVVFDKITANTGKVNIHGQ